METVIGGRYTLAHPLGSGGMGVVYRATDRQTGEIVAVKRLKSDIIANNPDLIARFRREGETLRRLNHPNIVHMQGTVEEGDDHYIVMDFVPGGDLNMLLRRGRLPLARTLSIALDVADALTRAHRLGVIHRDLKPANVLIAADGTPRLTDFGVAHIDDAERVTATGAAVGTLDYLAPEAIAGDPATVSTDIWAFGVMLFEMLSGERPFRPPTPDGAPASILHAIITRPPPDLQALAHGDTPVALVDLVYRMLEKTPSARIASVRQVGAELEAILQGRETPARITPPMPSATTPAQTNGRAHDDEAHTTTLPKDGRFATPTPDAANATPNITPNRTPVVTTPHNLPAQVTTFVGRDDELSNLEALLRANRFVTVFAPGGMGKTRIAIELGAQSLNQFPDGVFLIELAPVDLPAAIPTVIANAVGYTFGQNDARAQEVQLGAFLHSKTTLLILDNFEHVIAGAGIVTTLLNAAPNVRIVVTSRQRLNLSGETLFSLDGLRFPDFLTPADALNYGAIQLFMHSARRARPGYELSDDDVNEVVRICQMVQGMPLGIVLAASWLSVLSPAEIAAEVGQSAAFLETDMGDLPERQRGMRAVFDYSWNLLDETERAAFRKLSLFRANFSREAAQAVTGANLRLLMALTNKSLLRRDPDSGRYTIHELLRQFAEEKLNAAPDADAARDTFATFFYDLTIKMARYDRSSSSDWSRQISQDFRHVYMTWVYYAERGDSARVDTMLDTIYAYARAYLSFQMGIMVFDRMRNLMPMPPTDDVPIPRAARRLMSHFDHHPNALSLFERGRMLAQREGDSDEEAYCLFGTAMSTSNTRDYAGALKRFDEAASFIESLPSSRIYLPLIYSYSSVCAARLGDLNDARRRLERGIAQMETSADMLTWLSDAESWLGVVRLIECEFLPPDALVTLSADLAQVMTRQRGVDYDPGVAMTASILSAIRLRMGDSAAATAYLDETTRINRRLQEHYLNRLENATRGDIALCERRYADARRWYDQVETPKWLGDLPILYEWGVALLNLIEGSPHAAEALRICRDQCMTMPVYYRSKFGDNALYAQGFLLLLAALYEQRSDFKTAAGLVGLWTRGKDRAARHWVEDVPFIVELPARIERSLGAAAYAEAGATGTDAWAWTLVEGL
ncbi:MAG: protein kinase [Chloroflexota bacterium]|nr:protein kinase [Chloroflexota bacterium]